MNLKKILSLSLAEGRRRQHPHTGLVHFYYPTPYEENPVTIPVFENLVFALSLFRSHVAENIQEGKQILSRLLPFQLVDGQFPIYLHDFPVCKDRFLAASLLLPFAKILRDYTSILGQELLDDMHRAWERLSIYSLKILDENPPYHIGAKIAAALSREKPELWVRYREENVYWYSPEQLGDYLLAALFAEREISAHPIWPFLHQVWHSPTAAYCGPAYKEFALGNAPATTLLDLHMANMTGDFPQRIQEPVITHLYGALIPLVETKWDSSHSLGSIRSMHWECIKNHRFAISLTPYPPNLDRKANKGFIPFKILWGSPENVHSLVFQGGNAHLIEAELAEDSAELIFHFGAKPDVFDEENVKDLQFFLSNTSVHSVLVDGKKANTFQLGDLLTVTNSEMKLNFNSHDGNSHYFGHIVKANRPSQLAPKKLKLHETHDWSGFLRLVRRDDAASIKCKMHF